MMIRRRVIFLGSALLALGGCAGLAGSESTLPLDAQSLPAAWSESSASDAQALAPDWWLGFGSTELPDLMASALRASPDIAIAAEHVRQAEAQLSVAGASLFPALSLSAGTGHRETRPSGGSWTGESSSNLALSASYEVDLWGRLAAAEHSAQASLRATRFDAQAVRLALVAGVATGYFQVLSLRGRLAVAQQNLAIAERVLKVVDARARNGAASTLDLVRQQAAVLTLRASLEPLKLQERQTLYALAILVGQVPESLAVAGSGVSALAVPRVAPGLPAELIERRPDLASGLAQLAAADANIAVARAALLPGIGLTGSGGLASNTLINFLNSPTATLALGVSVLQPIFDGGRLRAQVDAARSRQRELVEGYRKLIYAALVDVENSLAAASRGADQELLQEQVLLRARRALQLAEIRYREGADDLLTVLDAQRTLFQAEDQLAQLRLTRLLASVALFKALGGGWADAGRQGPG